MARSIASQLSTARYLVAQFEAQLAELAGMNRAQRRGTERGRDLVAREPGLREGLATWQARAADLESRLPTEGDPR